MVSVYPATAREQRNMIKKWSVKKKAAKPARIRCMKNVKTNSDSFVWIGEVSPDITIWSTKTFEYKGTIRIESPNVAEIVQHSNGSVWVAAVDNIFVFDPDTRQLLTKFNPQSSILTLLPVVDKICMGCSDGKIIVWNSAFEKIDTLTAHSSKIFCLCLDYRGFLWSGSFDTTIIVWDPITFRPVEELAQHKDSIRSLDVKDEFVWSVSIDNTLRCWSNI